MLKALVFDFDGLIIETEAPIYQAWRELYREFDLDLGIELYAACIGASEDEFDPYDHLEKLLGRPLVRAEIRARQLARYRELVAAQPILPGVEDYLAQAARLDLKCAVASSSPREWVEGYLVQHRLRDCFQCLCTADDVARVKPDPELYKTALACLDVRADEAIAFEDSRNGVRAAKEAGLFCVAVPSELTRDMDLSTADYQLTSLADLPLTELLAAAAGQKASLPAGPKSAQPQ